MGAISVLEQWCRQVVLASRPLAVCIAADLSKDSLVYVRVLVGTCEHQAKQSQ